MSADLLQQLAVAGGGILATIAAVKVQIRDLERRMKKVEDCQDRMPNDYVPRRELSHTMRNFEQSLADTKEDVRASNAAIRQYVRIIARQNRKERKVIVTQ